MPPGTQPMAVGVIDWPPFGWIGSWLLALALKLCLFCAGSFMALLDNLIDSVVSKVAGEQASVISQFLKDNGGVSGLAQKFQSGGAGEVFSSWVGTGDNKAIASEAISKILG